MPNDNDQTDLPAVTAAIEAEPAAITTQPVIDADAIKAELDRARAALKTANAESASRRKRIEALEAEASRAAELQQTIQQRDQALADLRIKFEVQAEASRRNFHNAGDAIALVDRTKITIDGETVAGVAEAIDALVKDRPHLIKAEPAPDISATASGRGGGRLSVEELAAAKRRDQSAAYTTL